MDDLQDLYQDIILGHSKRPRNEGDLPGHTHRAEGYNPLCGDKVTVFLRVREGVVEDVRFIGEGCAISRASASIMTGRLKGLPVEEVAAAVEEVAKRLKQSGSAEPDLAVDGDLAALSGVRRFPARIKCATLAWHAADDALRSGGQS